MSREISFDELLAPVEDIGRNDALASWRWLVGSNATPLLLTALGDLFVKCDDGSVRFLDSYEGTLVSAAPSYAEFRGALQNERSLRQWFLPELLADLRSAGLILASGQCYSPVRHPLLGGQMIVANFHAVPWRVHLLPLGQLVEQIKKLPPGTPISGIDLRWK